MKKYRKKFAALALWTALCIQALAGCGQADDSPGELGLVSNTAINSPEEEPLHMTEDNAGDTAAARVSVLEGREPYDLLTQPWQEPQKAVPVPSWWNLTAYQEDLLQIPQDMVSGAKHRTVDGKDYYVLVRCDNYVEDQENWELLYFLNHVDGDTLEMECRQLYLEELELTGAHDVVSIDVAEGRVVAFVQEQDRQSHQIIGYYGVWFDQDGHVEDSQDLLPALGEARLIQEGGYLWEDTAKWDSRGYYCVRGTDESGQYGIIEASGELAMVLDPAQGLGQPNVNLYHDSQGRCIWEAVSYEELANVFWSIGEERQVKLYEGAYQFVDSRVMNAYGDLYYVNSNNALVRWDASTGSCENLYLGGGASFREYCAFLQNSSGDIVLFYDDGGREYLFRIANEDVEQVELTLACYNAFADAYTNMYVGEFNRLHPGVKINLQLPDSWEGRDSSWTRIQADLAAGNGPDLLMALPAQLRTLQEKGLLTELSQVLDQDTQEQIFDGVLENGMMNGGLYSISHTAAATTLFVSNKLWPEDTWTWEDVVALLEQQEQAGHPVQSILNEPFGNDLTGRYLLCYFFLADLEHCSLLDLEEGKAYFDTEEFCHLLEVCKRYAQTSSMGNSINMDTELAAARKRLKEGEILCYKPLGSAGDFRRFCEDMADLGEEYHMVGYPTQGDNGNFLNCYEGIAICADTEHAELAAEFLNYIVSRGCQEKADYPVRRDTFTERISEKVEYRRSDAKPIVFLRTPQGAMEIDAKPDGTSYLPEYLTFMDSCRISTGITEPIEEIILEEADAFFAGDKDARTVAGIIQSRVQLYLNENW